MSRATTPSAGARLTAVLFVAALAAVALVAGHAPSGATQGSPGPASTDGQRPSADTVSPSPPESPPGGVLGLEWAVAPDRAGLSRIGMPVGLTSGPGGIVATGSAGVAWSADGTAWQAVDGGPAGVPLVATAGGYFALADGVGWTSSDGRSWTSVDADEARGFRVRGIVAVGSTLLATGTLPGSAETWGALFTSVDGWTWRREPGVFPPFEDLVVSSGVVLATARVADEGRRVAVRMADGTWSALERIAPAGDLTAVAARSGGGFLAVGTADADGRRVPQVWSSEDGARWTPLPGGSAIAGTPTALVATAGGPIVATRDPTGFWRSNGAGAWVAAPPVPSFTLGSPSVMTLARDRVVALGAALDPDVVALAWSSPPSTTEPAIAARDSSERWTDAGRLPQPSDGDRLVGLPDGSLLLLGGVRALPDGELRYLAGVWRRSPDGRWTEKAPMPSTRVLFASAVARDGRVWVIGGSIVDVDAPPPRQVDIYDPAADSWARGPDLPPDIYPADALAMPDGSVVAISGGPVTLWRAEPGARTWRRIGSSGTGDWGFSSALMRDGSILIVATQPSYEPDPNSPGSLREVPVLAAYAVDPTTGRFERRHAPGGGATAGTLVRLGDGRVVYALQQRTLVGAGGGELLRRVDVYDPLSDSWSPLTRIPAGRFNAGVASDPSGRLWVAGGETEYPDVGMAPPTDALLSWTPPAKPPGGP